MKGVDRADQSLSYYSTLRKIVRWSQKVVVFILNCPLFNSFLMYKTLNKRTKKKKYNKFLHTKSLRDWITRRRDKADSSNDNDNAVPSQKRHTPRGSSKDPLGRLLGNFMRHKLGKTVGGEEVKKQVSSKAM